jgi:hypothetical protein
MSKPAVLELIQHLSLWYLAHDDPGNVGFSSGIFDRIKSIIYAIPDESYIIRAEVHMTSKILELVTGVNVQEVLFGEIVRPGNVYRLLQNVIEVIALDQMRKLVHDLFMHTFSKFLKSLWDFDRIWIWFIILSNDAGSNSIAEINLWLDRNSADSE